MRDCQVRKVALQDAGMTRSTGNVPSEEVPDMRRFTRSAAATRGVVLSLVLGAAVLPLARAHGEPPLPAPGSAARVAALVAASSKIQRLPNDITPNLVQAVNDDAGSYYRGTVHGCIGLTACVFGDARSKTTIVLFGDSHAYMWLPALAPMAVAHKLRLILVWLPGCAAASVTMWNTGTNTVYSSCNTFRSKSIAEIRQLAPRLVLVASRTTGVAGPTNKPISNATWESGLEATIKSLATKTTNVAVIGDIVQFSVLLPDCIAAEQDDVQRCSASDPTAKAPGHYGAEASAAASTHVHYVNPQPWLCTAVCSPVIGNMIAYYNDNHVTATYAAYLASDFSEAILPLVSR
jgi:hypothetical protein